MRQRRDAKVGHALACPGPFGGQITPHGFQGYSLGGGASRCYWLGRLKATFMLVDTSTGSPFSRAGW